jgi:hypothetical protein
MFTLLDPPSREENTSCSLLEEGLRSDDSDEYQTPSEEVMFLCAGNKKNGGRAPFDKPVESYRSPVFFICIS